MNLNMSKNYKHNVLNRLLLLIILGLFSGCVSSKKINYFQVTEAVKLNETLTNYEPKIQFGDLLNINVSSLDPDVALPFNLTEVQDNGIPRPLPYIVNAKGNINFPSIGEFKVSGLTISEITEQLNTKLAPFLSDPIINIRLLNFKVSVLGEVRVPGSYTILTERINIIEAIALAGDCSVPPMFLNDVVFPDFNLNPIFFIFNILVFRDRLDSSFFFL